MEYHELLEHLIAFDDLSQQESAELISAIMEGRYSGAQTAAVLTAFRCKGETIDEIVGAAEAMRSHAVPCPVKVGGIVDTCGTGGDRSGTFNISTTSAFVVAGAGIPVAKHGNRSASSQCGSIDVLEALGVNVEFDPTRIPECLQKTGMAVLFARSVHPAMKHAAPVRSELGIRTIFNWLGPLTNPARPSFQLVGISNPEFMETYALSLQKLGIQEAWVVSAEDGMDEISLTSNTKVVKVKPEIIENFYVKPQDCGLDYCKKSDLLGGDKSENARIVHSILDGEEKGPKREAVIFNAGAAIHITGKVASYREGVEAAAKSIDSGNAKAVLEKLIEFTNA